jgi:23S rRNA pseudouridine1911/1915/1917 synthase
VDKCHSVYPIVTCKPSKNKKSLINFLVKNNLEKRADIVQSKSKDSQECFLSYQVIDKNDFGYLLEKKTKNWSFPSNKSSISKYRAPYYWR